MLAILHVDRLLPVQHDSELRSLRRDLIGVPFAGRLRHRVDLGNVDDRAGAVGRIGPLVEDIHLVADLGVDLVAAVAAEEYAAVGGVVSPEFGLDHEVLVGVLGDQVGRVLAVELVGHQRAVLQLPIGLADLAPFGGLVIAVDQLDPAIALAGSHGRELNGGGADQKSGGECRQIFHVWPPFPFLVGAQPIIARRGVNTFSCCRCGVPSCRAGLPCAPAFALPEPDRLASPPR